MKPGHRTDANKPLPRSLKREPVAPQQSLGTQGRQVHLGHKNAPLLPSIATSGDSLRSQIPFPIISPAHPEPIMLEHDSYTIVLDPPALTEARHIEHERYRTRRCMHNKSLISNTCNRRPNDVFRNPRRKLEHTIGNILRSTIRLGRQPPARPTMPTEVYIEHETYIARDVPASHKRPASPKAHLPEHNKASRARISEQLTGSGQDSIRPRSTAQSRRHRWRTLRIIGGPPAGPFLWEPIRVLGQGAFGRVFLLRHLGEGKEIAMKVVYHGQPLPITVCKGIVNELRVLEVLHREPQPFINPPETIGGRFAWRSSRDFVHMLMPVCSGGELRERMREVSCECKLRLLAAELVLGIESLHNLGIVHHDLKPENILIDADGHCRIADFGSAMFIPRGKRFFANKTGRALITPSFAAPELIEEFWGPVSGNGYTQSIDWWALGAVLLSVQLSRTSAPEEDYFEFTDASDVADRHRRQIKRLKKLRTRVSFSDSFFDLISCLLHDDSAKRLTFETIKEHSFFHALPCSWDDIAARSDPSLAPFTRNTNSRPSYTDQDEYEKWPPSRPSINEGVTKVHLLNELHRRGLELNVDNSCDIELMQQIIDYGGDVML